METEANDLSFAESQLTCHINLPWWHYSTVWTWRKEEVRL